MLFVNGCNYSGQARTGCVSFRTEVSGICYVAYIMGTSVAYGVKYGWYVYHIELRVNACYVTTVDKCGRYFNYLALSISVICYVDVDMEWTPSCNFIWKRALVSTVSYIVLNCPTFLTCVSLICPTFLL